jgi:hypothetical protein
MPSILNYWTGLLVVLYHLGTRTSSIGEPVRSLAADFPVPFLPVCAVQGRPWLVVCTLFEATHGGHIGAPCVHAL